jgi:hypothetical protein
MMTKGNMGVGRRTMRNSLNISMRDAPAALWSHIQEVQPYRLRRDAPNPFIHGPGIHSFVCYLL